VLALIIILSSVIFAIAILVWAVLIPAPKEEKIPLQELEPKKTGDNSWRLGNNWFRKSDSGLWELYIEGAPFERGVAAGKLTRELMFRQEKIFVTEISKLIPSKFYLNFLKILVAIMNRRLNKHIGKEYCKEIHGISLSAPNEFSYIGPKYQRMLNYHAAHDIGHTLQSMNLVGCTAFSAWGNRSIDGGIYTGRNFDFYMGDEFSREKIVFFCRPEKGYRFASITWGGMIGTVSGMNEHGLAVTINGAKSEFPNRSATPISIMVREILQYARNIEQAYKIAEKKHIFVSESIVINSAEDHRTAIIEKSKTKTVLYAPECEEQVCTNHFQSEALHYDKSNQKYMAESPSTYRYQRVQELMMRHEKISEKEIASILRDKKGLAETDMGMGNEKAVDQLLAHHSIIFNPDHKMFWISCGPYPEGTYKAYDLNKIFATAGNTDEKSEISSAERDLPADPFLGSLAHEQFINYKEMLGAYRAKKSHKKDLESMEMDFIKSNPEMFTVYSALGDYYFYKKDYSKAINYYKTGLSKHVPNLHEVEHMRKRLVKAEKKLN
jgi:isopenicillin-N N-acyltransferase like protein